MRNICDNILETIGNTPIVHMKKFQKYYEVPFDIFAKLEFFNPLSSVKDRIALEMISAAELGGKITSQTTLISATAGNTGIGLAFIAAYKGYPLIIVMPENASSERKKIISYMGATLILTPSENGMQGAIDKVNDLQKKCDDYLIIDQFNDENNVMAHYKTTAAELWRDCGGFLDMLVAGIGSGGTLTGISKFMKEKNGNFYSIGVEPSESPVVSFGDASKVAPHKIEGIGPGFVSGILDCNYVDEIVRVNSDDAINIAQSIAKIEGVPVGISSGAVLAACITIGKNEKFAGKRSAVIVASSAERYLSTDLFQHLKH